MAHVHVREAALSDVPAIALLRGAEAEGGGADETRMRRYLAGEHHPRQALPERVIFVAEAEGELLGYVAGHLTRRYGCDGELQWIFVAPEHRGSELSSALLRQLAAWFAGGNAARICVDVDPANHRARRFYARHGARDLNEHWMVWSDIGAALPASMD